MEDRLLQRRSNVTIGKSWPFLLLLAAVAWTAAPAHGMLISIGGTDSETEYTGDSLAHPNAGVLTFFDSFNGFNSPEDGTVTSCDVDGGSNNCGAFGLGALAGGIIEFAVELIAPAPLIQASFGSIGAGAEILIWDAAGNIVLLAFQVDFLKVSDVTWDVGFLNTEGTLTLGTQTIGNGKSTLTVAGGSLNALVGGMGQDAELLLQLQDLSQLITFPNQVLPGMSMNYLNANFTAGFGNTPVGDALFQLIIEAPAVPEPSTAILVATGALGALALARRRFKV